MSELHLHSIQVFQFTEDIVHQHLYVNNQSVEKFMTDRILLNTYFLIALSLIFYNASVSKMHSERRGSELPEASLPFCIFSVPPGKCQDIPSNQTSSAFAMLCNKFHAFIILLMLEISLVPKFEPLCSRNKYNRKSVLAGSEGWIGDGQLLLPVPDVSEHIHCR